MYRLDDKLAGQLGLEALRYMYRLLFLFYIEARPELGYAPVNAEPYRKGYSLEHLRDLELVRLTGGESLNGYYIHESVQTLFRLIRDGFDGGDPDLLAGSLHNTFPDPPPRQRVVPRGCDASARFRESFATKSCNRSSA